MLAQVAAGLLLSQAARVHPVGWVAVAAVPLAQLACRGGWKRNARHAALATAIVGGVVAATSGRAVAQVLRGAMGAQYLPEVSHGWNQELQVAKAAIAGAVLLVALVPRLRGRRLPRVTFAAALVLAAGMGMSLLNVDVDWVRAAHTRMFVPLFVAALVGLVVPWLRGVTARRVAMIAVALSGLVQAGAHGRWVTELPTDALELRRALAWRERIPAGTRLVAVETAGVMAVQLPVYAAHRDAHAPVVRLDAHGTPPGLGSFGEAVYYYRSSLCSTAEAHRWCDELEESAELEAVDVTELPARPSTHAVTYEGASVRVGLYRVIGGH